MPNSKQIVYLSQSQYAELITNGTITVDGVTVTYDENDIYVTPQAEPVTDVRINGTSIAANGVANIPIATIASGAFSSNLGVVKVRNGYDGLALNTVGSDPGRLSLHPTSSNQIKAGYEAYLAVTTARQHEATFYGLAKAAGADMASLTGDTVGTYPPAQKAAIQSMLGISNLLAPSETTTASKAYSIGEVFTSNGKLYKATAAIAAADAIVVQNEGETVSGHNAEEIKVADYAVRDVQVNGTSVVSDGVANVPVASSSTLGVAKTNTSYGTNVYNGQLQTALASTSSIKAGTQYYQPIVPYYQDYAVFYGLAKAAGSDEKNSTLPVGQYTESAKSAISTMLNGPVSVTGSTPTITALPGIQYVCGEVATLDITLPASGIVDVVFQSGSTATVLTITPPSGLTVRWANGFDPTTLEANTTYEINIAGGLGVAGSWT